MKNINSKSLIINGILFLAFNLSFAQKKNNSIEIYQFHNEHRCVTCLEIEKLTKEVLKTQGGIPFKLINVDEKKNEKLAEKFEATSTALFLVNPKTGKRKDLTSFAFMYAMGEKVKFKTDLMREIQEFSKN
ncbi:MAG: nitrophenyl compound nitroreductase subunit ArsF family protein [Spirosomataceae bacterium]|jgi:hypothetical protein